MTAPATASTAGHGTLAAVPGHGRRDGAWRAAGQWQTAPEASRRPSRAAVGAGPAAVAATWASDVAVAVAAAARAAGVRSDRARGGAHGILAVDLGAQPGEAVAHGVHAVHRVGEVGLELEDGGAAGSCPHHRARDDDRRLSTLYSSACSGASSGACAGQPLLVVGLAARVALTSTALAVAQDGEGDLVAGALLTDVADEGVGRVDRSPLTATMTSPTFRPALEAGVSSPTEVTSAPARVAEPSLALPSCGVTPR